MTKKSLLSRKSNLSDPAEQLKYLSNGIFGNGELPLFREKIAQTGSFPLKPQQLEILQINLGYMCNQVCSHCHVDAGPDRKEIMSREMMQQCLEVIKTSGAKTLDLTGGAPEMNPNFRWFVEEASKAGIEDFIVRSNLTIILANKKYHDLPEFFKKHNIHVVSSLPFYKREKTDRQRGEGVFNKSIEALKRLNAVGYGTEGSNSNWTWFTILPAHFCLPISKRWKTISKKPFLKISEFGLTSFSALPIYPSVGFWNTLSLQRTMKTICMPWSKPSILPQ